MRTARLRLGTGLAALALVWLAMLLWGTGPLDRAAYEAIYAGDRPALVAAARLATALGQPAILITATVACALWLWHDGRLRLGLVLLTVAMAGRGLNELQKLAIARPRPQLEPHLVAETTYSFPSGHANSSMIFFLVLALALTGNSRWRWWAIAGAILLSLLIGTSRVMLGVHWPSDVIAGWAFGALWVLLTLKLAERFSSQGLMRSRNVGMD